MTRWLALVLVMLFASVAHAEDPTMRAAKRHFDRGEKLFALGKFDEALDEYQKAYDAKPIPDLLFNIGQCYRNLDDYDKAIFSFKKYLKETPDAPNKEAVDKLIEELEDKKAHSDGQKIVGGGGGRPTKKHPSEDKPIYTQWWFWTGVGVVAVAGSVGIYEGTKGGPPNTDLGNIVFGR